MAKQKTESEDNERNFYQIFSGTIDEIFDKLPKPDQRPYIIIGALNFLIILFICAVIFLVLNGFIDSVVLKIFITIFSFALIQFFHKKIISRLIHRFDLISKLQFIFYGGIISFLFYIGLSFRIIIFHPTPDELNAIENAKQDSIAVAQMAIDDSIAVYQKIIDDSIAAAQNAAMEKYQADSMDAAMKKKNTSRKRTLNPKTKHSSELKKK